jgi:hypothetical protein
MFLKTLILVICSFPLFSCSKASNEVVVYASVDQVFSEPILKDF